jgi:flagellar export protein FliJ
LQVDNRIDEIQSQIKNLEAKKKEELSNLDKDFNLAYTWSHYLQSIKTQKDFLALDLLQTEQDKEKVLEELSEAFRRTKTIQILLDRMEEAFKKSKDEKEQKDMEDVFSSFTQVTKKK